MRIAVVGGRLQGLEAAYLARKAGWEVVLIDKEQNSPARGLCSSFLCLDAGDCEGIKKALTNIDLLVPALENRAVLENLDAVARALEIPFAFDFEAFNISSSKIVSDRLFEAMEIPAPRPWPECGFPVVVKPSAASGSEGVIKIDSPADWAAFEKDYDGQPGQWVVQEYLAGPSYSIEVICAGECCYALQVTGLEMDDLHDCKRVFAPADLAPAQQQQFAEIAVKLTRRLNLTGIMDVEVIFHQNRFKVLEIDARLPSQTPTAVYQSLGINMLELLAGCFLGGAPVDISPRHEQKAVIFEHVVVTPGHIAVSGEHAVAEAGPLVYREKFFGADEALTNYAPGRNSWMATLITTAPGREEVMAKRNAAIERIQKELHINVYRDPVPAVSG
ncbi:MAG: 3-methylornithine--L-lysine ligase PylC [Bacillota bacterium]|nr:3-methylornithine--L-lysine ligase PylC [Bacillota bacterium]